MPRKPAKQFLLCINNDGYPASLELCKVYRSLPDAEAARHRMVRVIDESGEDYLFPAAKFVAMKLPAAAKKALARVAAS